jgi:transcriptional regulator with GAF, ATPase, and Fis domain
LAEPQPATRTPVAIPDPGLTLDQMEKDLVVAALETSNWNQKHAAELLGISVDRMNSRVKKWGLTHPSWRVHRGSDQSGEDE